MDPELIHQIGIELHHITSILAVIMIIQAAKFISYLTKSK